MLGRKQLYTKRLPARNEGHELRFETLPGFSRCFLPTTELYPAGKTTYVLLQSKRRSATSFVVGWRPVQTALQPSLRRQRFDVCSKFLILNCDHRRPWQKCKLMYHSVYACVPRVQNHMPRTDQSIPTGGGSCDAAFFAFQCRTFAHPSGIVFGDRLQNRQLE